MAENLFERSNNVERYMLVGLLRNEKYNFDMK